MGLVSPVMVSRLSSVLENAYTLSEGNREFGAVACTIFASRQFLKIR